MIMPQDIVKAYQSKNGRCRLAVVKNYSPISPRDFDNLGIMICYGNNSIAADFGESLPEKYKNFENFGCCYNKLLQELKADFGNGVVFTSL